MRLSTVLALLFSVGVVLTLPAQQAGMSQKQIAAIKSALQRIDPY